jgi:predicted RNase H-like HicB family nuclease
MPEDEARAIVYETDGVYMGLCPDFPGITSSGSTKEECIADLTQKIHEHLARSGEQPASNRES